MLQRGVRPDRHDAFNGRYELQATATATATVDNLDIAKLLRHHLKPHDLTITTIEVSPHQ